MSSPGVPALMQSTAPLTGSLIQSSNLDSSLASLHNSPFRSARKDSRHMSTASMGPGQQMENNGYAFLRCVPLFLFFLSPSAMRRPRLFRCIVASDGSC